MSIFVAILGLAAAYLMASSAADAARITLDASEMRTAIAE